MNALVARARALVGCRYRAQGRDPRYGLDCVGVVTNVFDIPSGSIPCGYGLRGNDVATVRDAIGRHFEEVGTCVPGDLMLLAPGRDQLHLAVRTDRGFVHANAGLRLVVETPGRPKWPVIGRYRRPTSNHTD